MKPVLHQGKLITWKDDRGFGFIKPNDGGKDVFLHISALKGASRRPKVGDRILYEQVTELDGKIRAARASIQGVAPRPFPTKRKPRKRNLLETVLGVVILAAMALFTIQFSRSRSPSSITSSTKPGCMIKGNISVTTGKKLYHLPAMEDYESTVIDLSKGERWFCTESEAIANGWRKAPR
ncbi:MULTISPECIES: cold shock domain-containing protein [Moorena]|uniref:DNA-binding protein n=1 Tax=Moorena bouillonii PNG TaxID=568701 RepID=A0A1U7N2Z1_9CYAN|nr:MULTISPECIES: cold shock domain-containing protein [Moorena]NEO14852.1 cold shock domain-containing protein [Moorena sp. SIO3E8]NEQ01285.1 cold shock domain-containing protein [Moorena sp. SIO3F7]OLT60313.1 DNA-binding protein [Moorena bouillonii PNG]